MIDPNFKAAYEYRKQSEHRTEQVATWLGVVIAALILVIIALIMNARAESPGISSLTIGAGTSARLASSQGIRATLPPAPLSLDLDRLWDASLEREHNRPVRSFDTQTAGIRAPSPPILRSEL